MQFKNITPITQLQKYIERIWVFECNEKMPNEDLKLVVPNGRLKLLVPFRNGVAAKMDGWFHHSKENSMTLIGEIDIPCIADMGTNDVTGTIGVEFSLQGAYHFFHLQFSDIKNQIHPLTDIAGKLAKQLEEQIANAASIERKIFLLQQFLLQQFSLHKNDSIFEYCVEKINASKGRISVKELEKKTGYSSRWLNMKFKDKIGISPKNLASIVRFSQYYNAFTNGNEMEFLKNNLYDFYYDQTHFLKDFKRFTGLSHQGFQDHPNDFGKLFYKE